MLAFLLQAKSWLNNGQLYLFALFMMMIWALWIIRVILSSHYRPWKVAYDTTTSVIIPVVDESVTLFRSVLTRILEQHPTEVIVVINGPRNSPLEALCTELKVRWCWTETPGKRNALQIGVGLATGEIAVLVDSDTIWTDDTLTELVKPFRDPRVGGVTTRQRILEPERTVLTRWADWLENVRNEYSMPAMSVLGSVGCLPGRTIAFRRFILVRNMDRFLSERFMGVFLEVSDDRTLTNYTLRDGFRTVYQSTSLVYTDAPVELGKLVRQQYRWARGSQYNTLRMLGWMARRTPVLATFYVADIVVPFVLVGSYLSWCFALVTGATVTIYDELALPGNLIGWQLIAAILGLSITMTLLSLMIRFARHFAFRPKDLIYLPSFMMINTLVLMPVRVVGFLRMAHNAGWGTRTGGYQGDRRRNALVLMPYLLGGAMLVASVMLGV